MTLTRATTLYDTDFLAWTQAQVELLQREQWDGLDRVHLIEELQSLGRSERREFSQRLAILLMHCLKWEYQPDYRSNSWQGTIREQRRQLQKLLQDNPSLQANLDDFLVDSYTSSIWLAMTDTNLPVATFPAVCPYTWSQVWHEQFPFDAP